MIHPGAKWNLNDSISALKTSDTGQTALNWMEVFRISHLPIVNEQVFLGLISDTDIYDLNDPEQPIGNQSGTDNTAHRGQTGAQAG